MWSFLRPFSCMTKEMGSSHRVDVLTDAILYYGQKSIDNIGTVVAVRCVLRVVIISSLTGKCILKRFENALRLSRECEENLNDLMEMSPGMHTT